MIRVVPYSVEHFEALKAAEGQHFAGAEFSWEQAKHIEHSQAFTALSLDGRVLGCGGVVEYWKGRGEAWAFFSRDCKKEFLAITLATRRFLKICPTRRIEAAAEVGFDAGKRWLETLGFTPASPWPMKAYKPDGADCFLYAMVK